MQFLRLVFGWAVIAFSALMMVAAAADLIGGQPVGQETSVGVIWGMIVFFALTLYGGIWLIRSGKPNMEVLSRKVLAFVAQEKGRVTIAEVVLHCNLSVTVAKRIMDHFIREGMARLEVSDLMQEVYVFEGLLPDAAEV
ncbi:hypothetical protein [Deinococcus cellulosilyticus]|uniref:MarR family transcriptional regulator n=1 Tax=Deinococcus cellulosilyticus (strain DSM 18568 / NBRC 106333 / KACC 11606 / 5516J-15) TaxID=1223518 RepID=A0A511NB47_DEIC1|nr:hypothetical protein [Deinococcus cellulosilyticus]GEM49748.1 hypothetical protein DC3_53830 [Deinococcus cellulosilyticus NBRC 106333 = KACC 11606]